MRYKRTQHEVTASVYDKKGNCLATAKNSYRKTHPLQAYFASKVGLPEKIYLHAEIAAILKAGKKQIHKIKIERYGRQGSPLNAKPCPICEEAIKAFGISFVEYTEEA